MTNEEVKGRLESFIDTFNICKEHDNALVAVSISKEDIQAFTQAIKALEQQACEDAVSRQEAIKLIQKYGVGCFDAEEFSPEQCERFVISKLNSLPSVTPKERNKL